MTYGYTPNHKSSRFAVLGGGTARPAEVRHGGTAERRDGGGAEPLT
jgi:hypothetical protein